MKQKYIFDLDGTLLDGDFKKEKEYFKSVLTTTDSEIFIPKIVPLLEKYESKFKKYDIDLLSRFMSEQSSVKITPNIIKGWIEYNKDIDNKVIEGAIELLEYLKTKDKQLVILTNWFSDTQKGRLKKSHLNMYFDEVYGGEIYLKPHPQAYKKACGSIPMELCVMIGDNYKKDIEGARSIGMNAIYFNRKNERTNDNNAVKSLRKIKDIY